MGLGFRVGIWHANVRSRVGCLAVELNPGSEETNLADMEANLAAMEANLAAMGRCPNPRRGGRGASPYGLLPAQLAGLLQQR